MKETSDYAEPSPGVVPVNALFRRHELEALLHTSRVLASSLDLPQCLQAIVAQAAAVSGIPTVRLFLLDDETRLLRCWIGVGLPIEVEQDVTVQVGEGLSGQVAATRRPLAVSDMRQDPRLRFPDYAQRHGRVSFLGLPVVYGDHLLGVLVFNTPEPRTYTDDEMALLTAFAQLAAAAIHHAEIHEAASLELRERRQAEAALSRREQAYRSLTENLPDLIARFDPALRCIYLNARLEAEIGIPSADALGRAPRQLGFPPGRADLWEDALQAACRDGQIHTVEYHVATPRGDRDYETRVVPERGSDGALDTLLLITRDMTERKAAEHALAERTGQLEAVRAITIEITRELDLDRLLELIVRRAVELVGGAAGAVILWENATQSLVPRAWHGCGEWISSVRGRLGEGLTGTVALRRQGMCVNDYVASPYASLALLEHVPVAAALSEPLLYQDRLLGVVVLYHVEAGKTFADHHQDLLALLAAQAAIAIENARLFADGRRSYQELQRAQEQLIQTEKLRALGQMSAGMAHDLNNVLAAVLGQVELLQIQATNPDVQECLRTLEMAARDGAHIIRRLQDFGRRHPSQPLAPIPLSAVVEQALEITRPRWKNEPQRRGVAVEVRTSLRHLPPVLGDEAEIREVLMNLVLNAVDAMPGGGALEITGRLVDSDRGTEAGRQWVELYVTDTGTGMTEEVRRRIFEPFFTTKGVHGSGLGLSVVYGIMERHGGHIAVASVPGQGSTFTLRFQVATGPATQEADRGGARAPVSRRILLVDDEPHVRKTMAGLLRSAGHTVVEAEGSLVALNRLAEQPVDLVLTDLGMPDMNGIELAQTIKLQSPTLPVVILTGWGNRSVRHELTRGTLDAVLGKPVGRDELLACVEACVQDTDVPRTD